MIRFPLLVTQTRAVAFITVIGTMLSHCLAKQGDEVVSIYQASDQFVRVDYNSAEEINMELESPDVAALFIFRRAPLDAAPSLENDLHVEVGYSHFGIGQGGSYSAKVSIPKEANLDSRKCLATIEQYLIARFNGRTKDSILEALRGEADGKAAADPFRDAVVRECKTISRGRLKEVKSARAVGKGVVTARQFAFSDGWFRWVVNARLSKPTGKIEVEVQRECKHDGKRTFISNYLHTD